MKKNTGSTKATKRAGLLGTAAVALGVIAVSALSVGVFAAPAASGQYIGEAKAKSAALEHAGISASQATFINAHLDRDNGRTVYDVEFYSGNTEYDYEIDAVSGTVLEYDRDIEYYSAGANSPAPGGTNQYIGEAKAKSLALGHAGVTEAQTTFIKAHLDHDDGRIVYDVEFYSGDTEYDYEIGAVDGSILEYDRDIEYYSAPAQVSAASNASGRYIGEAKAKSLALAHSKVAEAQATFIKAYLDYDDGHVVYDVEFYSGNAEYDYEVDAVNGNILEYDRDIEYYSVPAAAAGGNAAGQYIGDAKAKAAALSHAGVSQAQATFIKTHLDYDDGLVIYDIEFYSGDAEYDYEIDAISGNVLEYDREIEYYAIPSASAPKTSPAPAAGNNAAGQYIGDAKAKSLALSRAGLSETQVRNMKIDLDREDGRMVYEVDFKSGQIEYEYEIDAVSGAILKSDVEYDD